MSRVLVLPGDFFYSPVAAKRFKEKFNVTVVHEVNKQKLLSDLKNYDAVLARSHVHFDKELLDASKNLKIISKQGAGYDDVDATYAAKKGIIVTNTPNVIAKATADIAICHLLSISRHFTESERWLRAGHFSGGWEKFLGRDPEGKTLGILGLGSIGREIAKRAFSFDMKIIYHNRKRLSEEVERVSGNARYVSKDELLAGSDYISVNVFASPATKHILNTADFEKMKKGVYIINTSRGITINEQALVDALRSGKVAGAGLDVFEHEPEVHPDLKKFPNVCLTPHIGTASYDTRKKMEELAMDNVEAVLDGKKPITPVPECAQLKAKL